MSAWVLQFRIWLQESWKCGILGFILIKLWNRRRIKEFWVEHKICFPVTEISSPTNLVFLMSFWGNINLYSSKRMQFGNKLTCWTHGQKIKQSIHSHVRIFYCLQLWICYRLLLLLLILELVFSSCEELTANVQILCALNLLVNLKASHHFYVKSWFTNNSECRICRYAMINMHTKFHVPSFCGSLVITTKPNAKEHFCVATMLFYILQNNYLNKCCIFYSDLLLYVIKAPSYRWYCSHLTSSCVQHVISTDCKK